MLDVNCDGINDIIVGEPLSAPAGSIASNAVGGAAAIYTGNADGTYNTMPFWTLANDGAFDAGINAGSLETDLGDAMQLLGYGFDQQHGPVARE